MPKETLPITYVNELSIKGISYDTTAFNPMGDLDFFWDIRSLNKKYNKISISRDPILFILPGDSNYRVVTIEINNGFCLLFDKVMDYKAKTTNYPDLYVEIGREFAPNKLILDKPMIDHISNNKIILLSTISFSETEKNLQRIDPRFKQLTQTSSIDVRVQNIMEEL